MGDRGSILAAHPGAETRRSRVEGLASGLDAQPAIQEPFA
jgi:hypothetical protein